LKKPIDILVAVKYNAPYGIWCGVKKSDEIKMQFAELIAFLENAKENEKC